MRELIRKFDDEMGAMVGVKGVGGAWKGFGRRERGTCRVLGS